MDLFVHWLEAVGLALFVLSGSTGLHVMGMLLCACLPMLGLGVAFWFSTKSEPIDATNGSA